MTSAKPDDELTPDQIAALRAAKQAARAAASEDEAGGGVADLERRMARLEKEMANQTRASLELSKQVRKFINTGSLDPSNSLGRKLQTIVRALYIDPEKLDYPHRLTAQRFGLLSQFDEDGITLAILGEAGTATSRFVEIGCGMNGGNSGFLANELGWSGLMIDAADRCVEVSGQLFPNVDVTQAWVTREEINELLVAHGMTGELDLLSIDIDGNDYWIWEALEVVTPRLVIMEANQQLGGERAVVVPYAADFDRHNGNPNYFGASLAALTTLAKRKGYRLVAADPAGPNAFFLRDDLAPHIPACEPAALHRLMPNVVAERERRRGEVGDPVAELFDYIESEGLPLVDVGE